MNFAISERGGKAGDQSPRPADGPDHELESLHQQLHQADLAAHAEKDIGCCYARSNKYWITDPTGIAWETFHTLGSVPTFDGEVAGGATEAACCAPA